MLGEVSLAAGMLGKIFDMVQGDKKDKTGAAAQGSGEFAALLGMGGSTANATTSASDSSDAVTGASGVTITSLTQLSGNSTDNGLDADTNEALNMLHDMTAGGLEGAMRAAMKKMREKVMSDMGVSEASLAAMDPKTRMAVEDSISKEVMRRMQEAMGKQPDGSVDPTKMADFSAKLIEAAKAYKNDIPIV